MNQIKFLIVEKIFQRLDEEEIISVEIYLERILENFILNIKEDTQISHHKLPQHFK